MHLSPLESYPSPYNSILAAYKGRFRCSWYDDLQSPNQDIEGVPAAIQLYVYSILGRTRAWSRFLIVCSPRQFCIDIYVDNV